MQTISWKFIIGMILLTTNHLFAWGGMSLFLYLARKTRKNFYYSFAGGMYALSWVMLIVGVILAGPEGVILAKKLIRLYGLKGLLLALTPILGITYFLSTRKKAEILEKDIGH